MGGCSLICLNICIYILNVLHTILFTVIVWIETLNVLANKYCSIDRCHFYLVTLLVAQPGNADWKTEPFDFLINGELVRMSLEEFLLAKGISAVIFVPENCCLTILRRMSSAS